MRKAYMSHNIGTYIPETLNIIRHVCAITIPCGEPQRAPNFLCDSYYASLEFTLPRRTAPSDRFGLENRHLAWPNGG